MSNNGIGKRFMEETQYGYMSPSDQERGFPQPPLEAVLPLREMRDFPLPDPPVDSGERSLRAIIDARQSWRSYSAQQLTIAELSYLLWCTQGVKKVTGKATFRTVPSAGARHPLETVLLVNRVAQLPPGLYWFRASGHRLSRVEVSSDIGEQITLACLDQEFIRKSAVTFIWIADSYRTTWRYGERGYRYIHLDAGHVCQNLYLAAEAIRAGACAIGAFSDRALNDVLGIDGVNQFVVYLAAVGKKEANATLE